MGASNCRRLGLRAIRCWKPVNGRTRERTCWKQCRRCSTFWRDISSLCLVRFQTNDNSTPRRYAHHDVDVRPTVGRVRIYHDDRLIAAHKRSYGRVMPGLIDGLIVLDNGAPRQWLAGVPPTACSQEP